jgi:hypothetical protein
MRTWQLQLRSRYACERSGSPVNAQCFLYPDVTYDTLLQFHCDTKFSNDSNCRTSAAIFRHGQQGQAWLANIGETSQQHIRCFQARTCTTCVMPAKQLTNSFYTLIKNAAIDIQLVTLYKHYTLHPDYKLHFANKNTSPPDFKPTFFGKQVLARPANRRRNTSKRDSLK